MSARPKLLFLAWPFPPLSTVGSVRTLNIAKYLTRSGWDVTVVTPRPSLWRYVEHPEEVEVILKREGIRRILTGHQWCVLFPDFLKCWNSGLGWFLGGICRRIARHSGINEGIGWIKAAEQACLTLTATDVDIILASGPPFASFRLAKNLSDKLGRPYVLDYRDPWIHTADRALSAPTTRIREEMKLIAGCSAVTVVSNFLDGRFDLGPKLHVITNGFDPEEMAQVKPFDFGHFAIVYAGSLNLPEQVITPVMGALRRLKETDRGRNVDWWFHYYGAEGEHVREQAERFGVTERVVLHGSVSRAEALSAVRGAGVTVVITSVFDEATSQDKGVVTGKIFEPLGLGTPILLIAPHGSFIETIIKTTGLAGVFTGSDVEGMVSFLRDAMCGRAPQPKNPAAYAWPNLARQLDATLREAVERGNKREVLS